MSGGLIIYLNVMKNKDLFIGKWIVIISEGIPGKFVEISRCESRLLIKEIDLLDNEEFEITGVKDYGNSIEYNLKVVSTGRISRNVIWLDPDNSVKVYFYYQDNCIGTKIENSKLGDLVVGKWRPDPDSDIGRFEFNIDSSNEKLYVHGRDYLDDEELMIDNIKEVNSSIEFSFFEDGAARSGNIVISKIKKNKANFSYLIKQEAEIRKLEDDFDPEKII